MKNHLLIFSLTFLYCFFTETSYSQTPITNANFDQAISTCLSTNPVDGMCSSSQYGAMPNWDVSNVTNMNEAFDYRTYFNADISSWDVSNVTNMKKMLNRANAFNQDIGSWEVSNVTNMEWMFANATSFNQDIGNWDVSNVTGMGSMFRTAILFNQNIENWDVSNVTNMPSMFLSAYGFNQDLGNWDVSNVTAMVNMFFSTNLSTNNYDAILTGWSTLSLQHSVQFGAAGINYCNGEQARQIIIDTFGWVIDDAGLDCSTLGIDYITSSSISIYPNPVQNILNISSEYPIGFIKIYNLEGQLISESKNNQIDVSLFSSGIYFASILIDGKNSIKKFIKD